ncbi:MAG: single-stranded DNA-binding protein [Pelosinus sp.]|nr:single-stranded DNA-binding protein [Pelosinus sp.]
MNKVILVGRLTQDPEVRYTANGKAVATFTVAVNRRVNGEEAADFIPVVVWEKLAEICGNNLTKGRRVLVEGRLHIRSYEIEGGEKRRVAEVVGQGVEFLDRPKEGGQGGNDLAAEFGRDVGVEIPY